MARRVDTIVPAALLAMLIACDTPDAAPADPDAAPVPAAAVVAEQTSTSDPFETCAADTACSHWLEVESPPGMTPSEVFQLAAFKAAAVAARSGASWTGPFYYCLSTTNPRIIDAFAEHHPNTVSSTECAAGESTFQEGRVMHEATGTPGLTLHILPELDVSDGARRIIGVGYQMGPLSGQTHRCTFEPDGVAWVLVDCILTEVA
jgi:hypothetical protein